MQCLQSSILWCHLLVDEQAQLEVASRMTEQEVKAGEYLIQAGQTGAAASKLYVVKSGVFEVRL